MGSREVVHGAPPIRWLTRLVDQYCLLPPLGCAGLRTRLAALAHFFFCSSSGVGWWHREFVDRGESNIFHERTIYFRRACQHYWRGAGRIVVRLESHRRSTACDSMSWPSGAIAAFVAGRLFFGTVPLLISVSKFSWFDLNVWNRHYTSQLGKARSFETPWRGVLNGAAVYDRALAPGEIARNYRLSRSSDALQHWGYKGLVVLCTFESHRVDVTTVLIAVCRSILLCCRRPISAGSTVAMGLTYSNLRFLRASARQKDSLTRSAVAMSCLWKFGWRVLKIHQRRWSQMVSLSRNSMASKV